MSLLSRAVDRLRPPTAELTEAREATAALWAHGAADDAAGIGHETAPYLDLNDAADEAIRQLPRGQRWRAFGGADELLHGGEGGTR